MYYPSNYMNLRFINPQVQSINPQTNRYQFNDFYMYNPNPVDIEHMKNQYFQYDNQYLLNDNYGTIRYNKNLNHCQETLNRSHKTKKNKKEFCHNCKNETLRRNNVPISDYFSQHVQYSENAEVLYNDYTKYYTYTMPKKNKVKNPTIRAKSSRSKSINSENQNERNRSKSKNTENNDEKHEPKVVHASRIQKFESKNKAINTENIDLEPKENEKEDKPQVKETVPPPPPPPPLDVNLLKSNTSFVLNRFNKLKSVLPLSDEKASKSFDAVVNELKIKLNKIKPVKEHNNKEENLVEKISELKLQTKVDESPKRKLETLSATNMSRNQDNDSGIQSTDAISRKMDLVSNSSLGSACSKSSKHGSLSRLKNASKSNFGIIGIFKKKSSLLSSNSEHTNSSPNLNMSQMTDSSSDLKKQTIPMTEHPEINSNNKLLRSSESFKLEVLNDSAECSDDFNKEDEEVKPIQEVKVVPKKVLFEPPTYESNSLGFKDKTNQILKKIQKRNTFSSLKTSKFDFSTFEKSLVESEEPVFKNRLVKSKSDYMNLAQKQHADSKDVHSSYETYDLIKIESLVDLSNKQNLITAFSTRNLFHTEKHKIDENNKYDMNEKYDGSSNLKNEFKNRKINDIKEYLKLKEENSMDILKSKSEIKINKKELQVDFLVRPIPSNYSTQTENFKNRASLNDDKVCKAESRPTNLIPSKYSSFTDLTKNKQIQNMMNRKFDSLKRSVLNEPQSMRLSQIMDEQNENSIFDSFRPIIGNESFSTKMFNEKIGETFSFVDQHDNSNCVDYENLNYFTSNRKINEQINEQRIQLENYISAVSSIYSKNFKYKNFE